MTSPTPPGWYLDNDARMRWWDGISWTAHVQTSSMAVIDPRDVRPGITTTAAVLAFFGVASTSLGALASGFVGGLLMWAEPSKRAVLPSWFTSYSLVSAIVNLAVAAALLVGGLGLINRRRYAPAFTAAGCVAIIVFRMIDVAAVLPAVPVGHLHSPMTNLTGRVELIMLVFPLATMCLACGSRTHRWLKDRS